jgi:hypothetical protein
MCVMRTKLLLISFCISLLPAVTAAQIRNESALVKELRQFYDSYGEDLRKHRSEAIANRYDERGHFSLGNGAKRLVSFEEGRKRYTTQWTGPKGFTWKDLSFEITSSNSAAVVGLFEWTSASGETDTFSYTAVLTKRSGQWRIRVEDESLNPTRYSIKVTSGDPSVAGPYKFILTGKPAVSLSAHRHTADRRITIKSGRLYILMGDLETAKVQRFDAGTTFFLPANTWHVEWWEGDITAEIETTAPARTEMSTPSNPRVP